MSSPPARIVAGLGIVIALAVIAAVFLADSDAGGTAVDASPAAEPQPVTAGLDAATTPPSDPTVGPVAAADSLPDLGAVPEITEISGWLNTEGASFDEVRGEVTIVQFWTFGCHNCQATIPHLRALYADRADEGLEIIGIHAHEFDRERDPDNVAAAVIDLGVTWPVALDTDKVNFREWQGSPRYWPRTYVIDADDRVRFDHIGEGAYDELAETVAVLLAADR